MRNVPLFKPIEQVIDAFLTKGSRGKKGGYLSIGQVEIVRYKANVEAVFRARVGNRRKNARIESRKLFSPFESTFALFPSKKKPLGECFESNHCLGYLATLPLDQRYPSLLEDTALEPD